MSWPLLLVAALAPAAADGGEPEAGPFRIRRVEIETRDVYSEEERRDHAFYRLVDALHWTTREGVVRRETWFGEGDLVTTAEAEELERNLRATGLFAAVGVALRETGVPGERDLVVSTRDRLSLVLSAAGAVAGGADTFRASAGETNLLGRGDRVFLSYGRDDQDDEAYGASFTDRHFLHPRLRLAASAGETDEGGFWSARLDRRFQHLEDPFAWSISASSVEDAADYFAFGDTVAEVPRRSDELEASARWAWGPRDARAFAGLEARFDDAEFEPAAGPDAGAIDVPGNTRTLSVGPFYRVEHVTARREVVNLDTLDFVQDLELGWAPELRLAAVLRDEDGGGEAVEPFVAASARGAVEAAEDLFVTASAAASWRGRDGETQARSVSAALHGFWLATRRHTLAASLTYDAALEREGLPVQLTLGEDNGLRGYPARHFAGDRRVRLNLEDRIDTGLEVLSVHAGLVAFADAGWVDGEPTSPDDVLTSVGFGLRLGSSELFGPGVLRFDVAFPLNDAVGAEDDVSISLAFGQVFTFFGNSSVL